MDHSYCSLLDPGKGQRIEPEVVRFILGSYSDSERKPADSESESTPSCSAVIDGEFSVQDMHVINPAPPNGRSSAKTRKRNNSENWKRNVRKRKWRNGEEHLNSSGKICPARHVHVEDTCSAKCPYRCVQMFSEEERENIHKSFWSLNEEEKLWYYNMYTERITKQRCRTDKQAESRRQFTFRYYLPVSNGKSQVCKKFFLGTLDISEKRIQYYHNHLCNADTGIHREKQSGLSKNKVAPTDKKQEVYDRHLDSSGQTHSPLYVHFEGTCSKGTPIDKKQEVCDNHLDSSGQIHSARYIYFENTCSVKCAYRCVHIFSDEERDNIRKNFWSLSEVEKLSYYNMYTERIMKQTCKTDKQTESRRKFTFKYYLPVLNEKIQVCKKFFLGTLNISEKRISYYHSHLHKADTGVHIEKQSGISKNKGTPPSKEQEVHDHINSLFPAICYYYSLSDTSRQYLEQKQSLPNIYTMDRKPTLQ